MTRAEEEAENCSLGNLNARRRPVVTRGEAVPDSSRTLTPCAPQRGTCFCLTMKCQLLCWWSSRPRNELSHFLYKDEVTDRNKTLYTNHVLTKDPFHTVTPCFRNPVCETIPHERAVESIEPDLDVAHSTVFGPQFLHPHG